jgi:Tol biopolymer transport system component
MRCKAALAKAAFAATLLVAGLVSCAGEEVSISPLPTGSETSDLGSGVRPLSFGPGYKGSPTWSSSGERIAFTVDGYVVDKSLRGGEPSRWTPRDFGATEIEAHTGETMLLLGEDGENAEVETLYEALGNDGDSPEVSEISPDILAAEQLGESDAVLAAIRDGSEGSEISVVRKDGVGRSFGEPIEGSVTGLSLSPNQRRAVLAVAPPGEENASELRLLDLANGSGGEIARLGEGREIFGSPQWTESGIYYVAGTEESEDESSSLYGLYRVPEGSNRAERAPGVGSEFAASSIKASPDGTKLAIIGRLYANSPTNLHILDLRNETFTPATSSEDMEIKNGPKDMAWSPDGESIAIVARGSFSNPTVRAASADSLLEEFYNLYEVPVGDAR